MSQTLNISTVVKPADGLIATDMDGEKVVLSISNGKYYNLGATGGRVWGHLAGSQRIEEVVELLLQEYQIDRKTCEADVFEFLNQVYKEGLIQVC